MISRVTATLGSRPLVAAAAARRPSPSRRPHPRRLRRPQPNPIGPAFGANDPCTSISAIVTRPSVTNSVCTVRPNHVEVETGYLNTSFGGGGNAVTYPQTLIRVGTRVPALELDVAPPQMSARRCGRRHDDRHDRRRRGVEVRLRLHGQVQLRRTGVLHRADRNQRRLGQRIDRDVRAQRGLYAVSRRSRWPPRSPSRTTNGPQRWSSSYRRWCSAWRYRTPTGVNAEIAEFTHRDRPRHADAHAVLARQLPRRRPALQLDVSAALSPTAATGTYHAIGFGASYYF